MSPKSHSQKHKQWVGIDKPKVEVIPEMHWTELLELRSHMVEQYKPFPPRDYGDNDASDPEQNWDEQ